MFSPVLLRAPLLLGDAPPAYALGIVPLAGAIVALWLRPARWRGSPAVVAVAAYLVLIAIAALRAAANGAATTNHAALEITQLGLLGLLASGAFLRDGNPYHRSRNLRALVWAPTVFVTTNVLLHLANIRPPSDPGYTGLPATMLGIAGISRERVQFPLAGGLNGIGPIAAVSLVACAVLFVRRYHRNRALAGMLLSLYVILLIDSRGALLFAAVTLVVIALTPRARKRRLGLVGLALPVLPFVLVVALTGLGDTSVGARLERDSTGSLSSGTGRTVAWREVTNVMTRPTVESLIGYGEFGQFTSGASINYAYLFRGEDDPLYRTAHNLALQMALDTGWIGAAVLLAVAYSVVRRLGRLAERDTVYLALLGAAIVTLLVGVVQAAPTSSNPDAMGFWVLLVIAATRSQPGGRVAS